MTDQKWQDLIQEPFGDGEDDIRVDLYHRTYDTDSRPALVEDEHGQKYVIKGKQRGREIVNEMIVSRLGQAIHAPVPAGKILFLESEYQLAFPGLRHFKPGQCYGGAYIEECTPREKIRYTDVNQNRLRFARLAVLYGWMHVMADHQFIYQANLVYSVDHARFFPDGPDWTSDSLLEFSENSKAKPDKIIMAEASIHKTELDVALCDLGDVTDELIASAVCAPANSWLCSREERTAMASYLSRRRDEMLEMAASCGGKGAKQ